MDKPIKILHVLGALNRGGAETMIMNIYRNIDREKIQFDFMIHTNEKCDYEDEIETLGGKIYRISKYNGKNHFSYKAQWNKFFKENEEYKIIHGHIRSTASIYLTIAKKYGRITIAHSHSTASRGNIVEQLVKNIMQYRIRYIADYFFACSNEAGKWLFGKKILKNKNYKVIKNGIEVEKYIFNEKKREKIRNQLNLNGKFVIGHVGSFTYPKNHKFLIEIFNEVYKKNKNSRLLLVGDGILKDKIENQVKKFQLEKKVIFIGNVPNVCDYLQGMDLFVFPSHFEGLGIVAIEAQASGLMVLASKAVPKEANITNLIKNLPLKKDCWVYKISKNYIRTNRVKQLERIKKSGYSIELSRQFLELFYIKLYERKDY